MSKGNNKIFSFILEDSQLLLNYPKKTKIQRGNPVFTVFGFCMKGLKDNMKEKQNM